MHKIRNIILPRNHTEKVVLFASILYFSVIAFLFLIHRTEVLPEMLGYDTSVHMLVAHKKIDLQHLFSWDIRHPLMNFMFFPPISLDYALSLIGFSYKWEIFTFYSALLCSYTGFLLFKTITMMSNKGTGILMLCLFCSFAHTILLSIQIDSFVYSMLFLVMLVLIYASNSGGTKTINFLCLGIAGTTSTNIIKFFIYLFLSAGKDIKKTIHEFLLSIPLFLLLLACTIPDFLNKLFVQHLGLKYSLLAQTFDYRGTSLNRIRLFIENFLSEPLLFHYRENLLYANDSVNLPSYPTPLMYIPVAFVYVGVIVSVVTNFSNRITQLFLSFIGVDLFIHFIVGYGIEEGQIFCAHWFFFIPIMLGMLDNRLRHRIGRYLYRFTIIVLTIVLWSYNFKCYLHGI